MVQQQICINIKYIKTGYISVACSRLVNCGFASLAAPTHPSHGCSPAYTHYHGITIHHDSVLVFLSVCIYVRMFSSTCKWWTLLISWTTY